VPPTQNSASSGCAMIASTRSTSRSGRPSTPHLQVAGFNLRDCSASSHVSFSATYRHTDAAGCRRSSSCWSARPSAHHPSTEGKRRDWVCLGALREIRSDHAG
jgi:hypothetical protein